MIIYDDHLECALALAIKDLRAYEETLGYTGPSAMLATLQEALSALQRRERIEVRDRSWRERSYDSL